MKTSKYLIVILIMLLTACKKKDHELLVPECIKSLIGTFGFCEESGIVGQYSFQRHIVYVFDPGNCGADMQSPVYNSNCECIGALGGFAGNNIINGVLFSENAQLIKIIWKNGAYIPDN
jgi:hypothetical protein